MSVRSFDNKIAQVPSRDCADRYFAPNINRTDIDLREDISLGESHNVHVYIFILKNILAKNCILIKARPHRSRKEFWEFTKMF